MNSSQMWLRSAAQGERERIADGLITKKLAFE